MKAAVTVRLDAKGRRKAKPVSFGAEIDLDERGNAMAFAGGRLVGQLQHAVVVLISKDGLLIRGFEERSSGRFVWQEWWVRPEPGADCAMSSTGRRKP